MSVSSQAYIFLCSVIGGMVIAFIYDAFRVKRKAVKTSAVIIYVEDLIFWIIVAVIMFAVIYFSNEGEIRGYIFIGSVLGIIIYSLLFSKIIMAVFLFALRTFCRVLKFIWAVITYPIRVTLKILSFPAGFILKFFKKTYRGVRRIGKNKLTKYSMWSKIFRNIRKKV